MTVPSPATRSDVHEWVTRGRELLRERSYAEAGALFDRALAAAPDDPEVQGLAVTAEFWRRLAREGDGIPPLPATAKASR